jgi:CheY-like chemotaxis protein
MSAQEANMTIATAESRLRVLVVDDDLDTVESTALFLRMQGHEAKTACDGAEAIEQAKTFCPQLILLDIAMPKMDGYRVARELRHIACAEQGVIVAVTGYASSADKRTCAEAGFDLHLAKPVDFDVLEQLVWLSPESGHLESCRLSQASALPLLIGSAIEMANTLLDAIDTHDEWMKARSIVKLQKQHDRMVELIQGMAHESRELVAALEELKRRYEELDVVVKQRSRNPVAETLCLASQPVAFELT